MSRVLPYDDSRAEASNYPGVPPNTRNRSQNSYAAFDAQNIGTISVNAKLEITDANLAFQAMSGYCTEDFPIRLSSITHATFRESDVSRIRQFMETGYCLPWQKTFITRSGLELPVITGAAEMPSADGSAQFFVANIEHDLQNESVILDYQSRLRHAAVELSLSAERERREIAGDLHDNIGQGLAIAKLKLGQLRSELGGNEQAELDQISLQIADALTCCRNLSHSLATPSLYKLGLVPALRNLISELNKTSQVRFFMHDDGGDMPLTKTSRIILYRVIRELLINIVRHAQAYTAEVSLWREDDLLKVVVSDDGIGFDPQGKLREPEPDVGLGLFLVHERLLHIGASLDLQSSKGRGTVVKLSAMLDGVPAPAASPS